MAGRSQPGLREHRKRTDFLVRFLTQGDTKIGSRVTKNDPILKDFFRTQKWVRLPIIRNRKRTRFWVPKAYPKSGLFFDFFNRIVQRNQKTDLFLGTENVIKNGAVILLKKSKNGPDFGYVFGTQNLVRFLFVDYRFSRPAAFGFGQRGVRFLDRGRRAGRVNPADAQRSRLEASFG